MKGVHICIFLRMVPGTIQRVLAGFIIVTYLLSQQIVTEHLPCMPGTLLHGKDVTLSW